MIMLSETSAFAECQLPEGGPGYTIGPIAPMPITSLAPWPGETETLRARLGGFPQPGEVIALGDLRLVWAGRDTAFAFGALPPADLRDCCALCYQSDGWAGLRIEGAGAEAFLARRLPFDLRKLPVPGSARSVLGHVPVLVVRLDRDRFELWGWRSMAASLLHELHP